MKIRVIFKSCHNDKIGWRFFWPSNCWTQVFMLVVSKKGGARNLRVKMSENYSKVLKNVRKFLCERNNKMSETFLDLYFDIFGPGSISLALFRVTQYMIYWISNLFGMCFLNIFFRKLVQFSCWCHCGHRCWTLRFRNNYNDSFILACPIRLFIWNDCLRTNCFVPDQTGFFRFIQLCGSSVLRYTSYYVIC